jgi:hypothetical protein
MFATFCYKNKHTIYATSIVIRILVEQEVSHFVFQTAVKLNDKKRFFFNLSVSRSLANFTKWIASMLLLHTPILMWITSSIWNITNFGHSILKSTNNRCRA